MGDGWIELNGVERSLAKHLAERRYATNRASGTVDRKVGPQSAEQTDLEGIGAELAYCKLMNLYPDLNLDERPIYDAVARDGRLVDVKATRYPNGHLLAVLGKANKPPDMYVLMIGEFPRYRCAGFISSDELLTQENIKDFGHGPTYAAPQGRLMQVAA